MLDLNVNVNFLCSNVRIIREVRNVNAALMDSMAIRKLAVAHRVPVHRLIEISQVTVKSSQAVM